MCASSCKVVTIPEKWLFVNAKYDNYLKEINNNQYSEEKKCNLQNLINKIITDSIKHDIIVKDDVSLSRNYFLSSNNISLEYFVFKPKIQKKVSVFFIGAGLTIFPYLDLLFELSNQTNAKIYVIHYRDYGYSDGRSSFVSQMSDNQDFIDKILKFENKIDFIAGYSIGTIFTTYLAVENSIDELYLFAPIYNSTEWLKHIKRQNTKGWKFLYRPFVKLKIQESIAQISPAKEIKKYSGKLVIFHGKKDNTIPYRMGKKLYKIAKTNNKHLYEISNANHSFIFNKETWSSLIAKFRMEARLKD